MDWKEKCFAALDAEKVFETSEHRTRFKELVDCFSLYPFFTRGLCKCIYLSAWDEEHFCVMLETLTDLSLGRETNTQEMTVKGTDLADENTGRERYMYQLSLCLLDDKPFDLSLGPDATPEVRYLIRRALQVSDIIDAL